MKHFFILGLPAPSLNMYIFVIKRVERHKNIIVFQLIQPWNPFVLIILGFANTCGFYLLEGYSKQLTTYYAV